MPNIKFLVFSSWILILSGCSLHTVNQDPQSSKVIPATYSIQATVHKDGQHDSEVSWWEDFKRPDLNTLINQALTSNPSLVQAAERVIQARTLILEKRSLIFPSFNLEGDVTQEWESEDRQRAEGDIGLGVKWGLDIFGQVNSAVHAARFNLLAREHNKEAIRLALTSDIALTYFGAVAAQRTLSLLETQAQVDRDLLDLVELRLDNGLATTVDVLQQKSRVADSEALIPQAQAELRVFENRLDVLIGEMVDGENRVSSSEGLNFEDALPNIGVPADLLLRRPDLQAARAELIAADADIAVAIANRMPNITLDGRYVYSDTASFSGPLAVLMASFVQPLLDWGQRKATVERNASLYREKLAVFTQTYLQAVEDVENALYQENRQREFVQRLKYRQQLLQQTVDETEARYKQGVDTYLPVLNALQELRNVERRIVREELGLIVYRIALYQSTGGVIAQHLNKE
jgi:NodT family efflux transporter outer membrane factor (OMF) lipoprotein